MFKSSVILLARFLVLMSFATWSKMGLKPSFFIFSVTTDMRAFKGSSLLPPPPEPWVSKERPVARSPLVSSVFGAVFFVAPLLEPGIERGLDCGALSAAAPDSSSSSAPGPPPQLNFAGEVRE